MGIEEYEWELQDRGYDDTEGERVCLSCVLDPDLRANLRVSSEDTGEACIGCQRLGLTVAAEDLLSEWLSAVHLLYADALGFMPVDKGEFVFSTTDARDVVEDELSGDVTEEVFAALREYIRYDVSLAHDFDQSDALESEWVRLREALASAASGAAASDLDVRFLTSFEGLLARIPRLLRVEGKGARYWRVRNFDAAKGLDAYDSSDQMGAPISTYASDSRFSRAGQPAFYCAPALSTSVAEVFQGVSGTAVKASFVSVRDLTLLDLVDLPKSPSIYDRTQTELFLVLRFLKQFAQDVSRPVIKSGAGHYLPTQRITDVVRSLNFPSIQGIRYTSAQNGLPSVVIFAAPANCANPGDVNSLTLLEYERLSLGLESVP